MIYALAVYNESYILNRNKTGYGRKTITRLSHKNPTRYRNNRNTTIRKETGTYMPATLKQELDSELIEKYLIWEYEEYTKYIQECLNEFGTKN